ncbi:hypothetical protein [Streptomyces sp. NBC_00470]|uniref:hypothetical protein n=1 Tax=Streptomyces sp. NBC_00470 TaxID=2975753 RepID=UPI0030E0B1C1
MGKKKSESRVTSHKKDPHSLKTTDRRRSGVGDNVAYKVKDSGGGGGNRFADFFSTASYSSGPSSGSKSKKK